METAWAEEFQGGSPEAERKYRGPLGRRPDDHPGLSELGL